MIVLIAALALAAALYAPRVGDARLAAFAERAQPWLRRFGPVGAAVISIILTWWVWGEVIPVPTIHDEASYVLQSEIFARGRWTVPSPPLPEFFEQPHVLVVPAVASKYPPGHALLLTPGTLLGFPPLVPLLLAGVTAALLFALVNRIANSFTALFAWLFWLTSPLVLRFQPKYMSEVTTAALMLVSWWALLEWRSSNGEGKGRRWLFVLALAVGWGAITRPYTTLLVAIPIGVVVLRDVTRWRRWRDLGLALALGTVMLGVLPLWAARTTGDWRLWPQELYRRDYMPFDKLGFAADSSIPRRAESHSQVLIGLNVNFYAIARAHTLELLPQVMGLRVSKLTLAMFPGERLPLMVFAVIGLFASGALQFAAISALLVFAGYLAYPHASDWPVYYLETAPVIAALTAVGAWRAARFVSQADDRAGLSLLLVSALLVATQVDSIRSRRRLNLANSAPYRAFLSATTRLPRQPAIVFLRYGPRTFSHLSVVWNSVDLDSEPVWVVHDRGDRNAALLGIAPDRTPYTVHEDPFRPGSAESPTTNTGGR